LTSHGYLRRIAYDQADEIDRTVEVRHNQAERKGTVERKEEPVWTPSKDDFDRLRRATKGIGKEI
jgi:hypothetical protein